MERRSRNILVVLIVLVIAVAVFSSFGVELYAGGIPEISLPTLSPSEGPDDSGQSGEDAGGAVRVAVTPETVRDLAQDLFRFDRASLSAVGRVQTEEAYRAEMGL